mgnify:CR=1 FL=1
MNILKTFVWYDQPLLFVGETNGIHYLGLNIEENPDETNDHLLLSLLTRRRAINVANRLTTPRQAQRFANFKMPLAEPVKVPSGLRYEESHFIVTWGTIDDPSKWVPADVDTVDVNAFRQGYSWNVYGPSDELSARQKYKLRHKRARR